MLSFTEMIVLNITKRKFKINVSVEYGFNFTRKVEICVFFTSLVKYQKINGPVNAPLRPEIYSNKLV